MCVYNYVNIIMCVYNYVNIIMCVYNYVNIIMCIYILYTDISQPDDLSQIQIPSTKHTIFSCSLHGKDSETYWIHDKPETSRESS